MLKNSNLAGPVYLIWAFGKFITPSYRYMTNGRYISFWLRLGPPLENGLVSFRKASSLRETRHVTISLGGSIVGKHDTVQRL